LDCRVVDYHVHPDYSPDATGKMAEYCRLAVDAGLQEICFTTHYEPDPVRREREWVNIGGRRVPMQGDWVGTYFAEIADLRQRFKRLAVLAGVEVGYEPGLEEPIAAFLAARPFDFVIGAVHSLDHVALTSGGELDEFRRAHGKEDPIEVVARYFSRLTAVVRSGLFDAVAHIDAYRKYIRALYDRQFEVTCATEMPRFLAVLARTGTALEINTSALRRGMSDPYPAWSVLDLAITAGVRRVTVGSDAHRPDDVGSGIAEATCRLASRGLRPLRFRSRRALLD
jgi:histidinol-phosphatase (PHP family)